MGVLEILSPPAQVGRSGQSQALMAALSRRTLASGHAVRQAALVGPRAAAVGGAHAAQPMLVAGFYERCAHRRPPVSHLKRGRRLEPRGAGHRGRFFPARPARGGPANGAGSSARGSGPAAGR